MLHIAKEKVIHSLGAKAVAILEHIIMIIMLLCAFCAKPIIATQIRRYLLVVTMFHHAMLVARLIIQIQQVIILSLQHAGQHQILIAGYIFLVIFCYCLFLNIFLDIL